MFTDSFGQPDGLGHPKRLVLLSDRRKAGARRSTRMEPIPRRTSLVAQTATILRESIQAGLWREVLPSEHELCERLRVSRVTLRAALLQLQREGWVEAHQGRRRRIRKARPKPGVASPSDRVVLLSPVSLTSLPATALFWVDALRDHLSAAGYRLEFHASQACTSRAPGHALEALARRMRPAAWLLYLSTPAVQEWFSQRGLPCLIVGSRHAGVALSSVDVDYAATCAHAAGLLAAKGHRRIALVMPRTIHAGDLESVRGFTEAGEKLAAQGIQTVVAHHDGSAPSVCRVLDGLLRGTPPVTALVVAKPAHVLTAVCHLLRSGQRLPRDISLIARDDDPCLEHLVPVVTRYHTDPVLFARKISRFVVDLVRNGVRRQHDSRLMPTLLRGETVGDGPRPA